MTESAADAGYVLEIRGGAVVRKIPVGWAPASVAVGSGSVWVSDTIGDGSRPTARENDVARIDPTTGDEIARVPITLPRHIVIAEGGPWVTTDPGQSGSFVDHIDPSTNRVTSAIPVAGSITGIAYAGAAVWVSTVSTDETRGSLVGIDPSSGRVQAEVALPGPATGVLGAGSTLWVALPGLDPATRRLLHVDPASGTVQGTPIDVKPFVGQVDPTGRWLWAARDETVTRLAADDLRPSAGSISLPPTISGGSVVALSTTTSAVWVLTSGSLVSAQLDPSAK